MDERKREREMDKSQREIEMDKGRNVDKKKVR